jgi:predicted MFS family arabinose efflux permease
VKAPEGRGQIRAGLQYVRQTPVLLWSLLMMAVAGTLALNFQIIVPLLTKFTFHRDITTFGLFTATMGVGSFIGAMYAASRRIPSLKLLTISCAAFGLTMIGVALTPTMEESYISLALLGLAAMIFISTSNTVLQLRAAPEMRGRVLALWSLVFLGSTPIGGPFIGWVSQHWSPRVGFMVGGVPTLAIAVILGPLLLRRERADIAAAEAAELEPVEAEMEAVASE